MMSDLLEQISNELGADRIMAPDDVLGRPLSPLGEAAPAVPLIRPRNTTEVSTVLRLCHAVKQSLISVGGATGLAGGLKITGDEWLISLELMSGIETLEVANRVAVVGAGVKVQQLQDAARDAGLLFPVDFGARGSATIGGAISTNAGGEKALRFGMMREQVLGLEVVLASGEILDLMGSTIKNNAGYDLKQMFIGAEGTLGIVTRATLRLRPELPVCNTAFAALESFEKAQTLLARVERCLGNDLTAFEIMWPAFYDTTTASLGTRLPVQRGAGVYVLFETESGTGANLDAFVEKLEPFVEEDLVMDIAVANSLADRQDMWAIRNNIEAIIKEYFPGIAYDISVPNSEMAGFVETIEQTILAKYPNARTVVFGHMGDNNLHLIVKLGDRTIRDKDAVNHLVYSDVSRRGGSISAEHGIGADKRPYLHYTRDNGAMNMMRQLKKTMDPMGILNPNKII